ncbi:unnamed protein product [Mycena citricolor]|uniref:Uncharacterized protein n=1 Tax=Mycena citricolor TaxID=2018698 RepID=A0AAD2H002_9AGAR|nr:unnamed protein product [Mycena citricolor]
MHPTSLAAAVRQRLQIKKPDVHPEDPYDLTDLYDAAKFVLAGSSSSFPSLPLPSPKAEVMVKPDPGISALVSSVQTFSDSQFPASSARSCACPVPPTSAPLPSTHPFAAARDGAYAPPKQRNLGVPAAKALPPRSAAPIYNPKDAATVFDSVLDTPITQTLRQVLSTAPEVRAQMREATSYRRAPAKTGDVAPQFFKAASVAVAEEDGGMAIRR